MKVEWWNAAPGARCFFCGQIAGCSNVCWGHPKQEVFERAVERMKIAEAEVARLRALINTPSTADFLAALPLEAAHQVERWGVEHDRGKDPSDWFWLLGYLGGKALRSAIDGDVAKAKHHCISSAAVLLNWHRRLSGEESSFQPASDGAAGLVDGGDR